MKELSPVRIVFPRQASSRIGYSFECTWSGTRERVENEFLEAQSGSPSVSWIVWRITIDWNASIGGPDRSEVETFGPYLM